MTKKIVIEFDVIIPSHIQPETFNSLLTNYMQLFRFTTQLHKVEVHEIDTHITINPIFRGDPVNGPR